MFSSCLVFAPVWSVKARLGVDEDEKRIGPPPCRDGVDEDEKRIVDRNDVPGLFWFLCCVIGKDEPSANFTDEGTKVKDSSTIMYQLLISGQLNIWNKRPSMWRKQAEKRWVSSSMWLGFFFGWTMVQLSAAAHAANGMLDLDHKSPNYCVAVACWCGLLP